MNKTMLDVMIAGAKRRRDLAKKDGALSTRYAYHKGAVDALVAYREGLKIV